MVLFFEYLGEHLKINKMKTYLIKFYLDFVNDFLTLDNYAEYHGITREEAETMFLMGKKYHNEQF